MSDGTLIPGSYKNVNKSDTADLGGNCMGLWVGAAGAVTTTDGKGNVVTWQVPIAPTVIVGKHRFLNAATTVADGNIVALYSTE